VEVRGYEKSLLKCGGERGGIEHDENFEFESGRTRRRLSFARYRIYSTNLKFGAPEYD
jgi:hypothetical protein